MRHAILLIAAGLFLLPAVALADESFTLNIPNRFDAQQQTGEVRIVLSLNAAPAGAQLVVGGSATVALGATQTVNGDSVTFSSLPNNRAMIRYRPLSNFTGDFCQGANATDKSIPIRFVGAQDITEYRISSFVVAAPAYECSDVSRRIADMPATIDAVSDGVAPALSATFMGRLPIDVILVLDKSGSMADVPPGAGMGGMVPSKAAILRAAAKAFVAAWRDIDAPIGAINWSEDRLGVVFFDAAAAAQHPAGAMPPANFFVERGSSMAPGPWDAILTTIDTLAPGSSTSIGAGINSADQQWVNDPAHDLQLVLVTDGMQNTAPLVAPAPSGFLALPAVGTLPSELRKRFVPIYDVAFGTPAQVDHQLLNDISLQTAGRSYQVLDTTMMYTAFANTLVAILKGNTISLANRFRAAAIAPAPHLVEVDPSARRVVFSLQWAPPFVNALDFDVFRPGSNTIASPTRATKLPQASLQTFDLGSKADLGTWSVRVRSAAAASRTNVRPQVPYTLHAFFLERHLDYRLSIDPPALTRGSTARVRAEVSYDGKPLTKLPDGAIHVHVLRSVTSVDALLKNAEAKGPREVSGDPTSELQRKMANLSREDVERLRPREVADIVMKEERRGIYSATIPAAAAGSYTFEVVLDWNDSRTGHVHRVETLETLAAVR